MADILHTFLIALPRIRGYTVPLTQDQGSQCQMCISFSDAAFYTVQTQVEAQKKILEVLFAIGKLGDNQLHETYSKIDSLFTHKLGCEFTRAYCREKFRELLEPWDRLSANNKKSIVNLFLRMKYYDEEPTATNDILPIEFVYSAEFVNIAMAIVAGYPTDEEKMRQFEFAPLYIYERAIPPAKILLEANMSDIDHVNVLMIGDNGIGKSCLGNSFCRPARNRQLKEGNCTGVAMTNSIESVQYTLNGRSVRFIDTPGFYNVSKVDKEQNLQFHDLPSYVNFILSQVACNAPHIKGEKIHIVLFCLQKPRIEDWQLSVINAVAEFVRVMVVQLQCSSEENLRFLEVMKTDLKDYDIASFHAVLAKDKTIKERTTPAHGMHDLARAMARELLNWKNKNDELLKLFETNQDAYYWELKKKGLAIVAGFTTACAAAGLSPFPFTDLAMIIPLHVGMFGAIMRLYGMQSPVETLKTIAHGLWTGAATNIPVTAARVALFGLEALKIVPLVNIFAMLGASAFHGAATSISGVSFLNIIHNKALKGDFSEITEHNQHLILEEMKAEKTKINTTKEK